MNCRTLLGFNLSWTLFVAFLISCLLQTSRAQFSDDDFVNELMLRRFRRENLFNRPLSKFMTAPKRQSRHIDYVPTPCRWKLCASLLRN